MRVSDHVGHVYCKAGIAIIMLIVGKSKKNVQYVV